MRLFGMTAAELAKWVAATVGAAAAAGAATFFVLNPFVSGPDASDPRPSNPPADIIAPADRIPELEREQAAARVRAAQDEAERLRLEQAATARRQAAEQPQPTAAGRPGGFDVGQVRSVAWFDANRQVRNQLHDWCKSESIFHSGQPTSVIERNCRNAGISRAYSFTAEPAGPRVRENTGITLN